MDKGGFDFDRYNPLLQNVLAEFERKFCGKGGLEQHEDKVGQIYNAEFVRPYVCALLADVKSGRWGLGKSQSEISDCLGVKKDRTWFSRGLRQGRLAFDTYMRLRCWTRRPANWEPDVRRLGRDMDRSGFMGAARYLATLVKNRPELIPRSLTELDYELMCAINAKRRDWLIARVRKDSAVAFGVVATVCRDSSSVLPSWYPTHMRRRVSGVIRRIEDDPAAAYAYLDHLELNWQDVFVATVNAAEPFRLKSL